MTFQGVARALVERASLTSRQLRDDQRNLALSGKSAALISTMREEAVIGRFVDRRVAKALVDEGFSALDPAYRRLTVAFWDIAGSTSIINEQSERASRELIWRFYRSAEMAIDQHSGLLDKFMGDGAMALFGVWNGHESGAEHDSDDWPGARQALLATALLIDIFNAEMIDWKDSLWKWQSRVAAPPRIPDLTGGIASGRCLVGDLGPHGRFVYTAIGDAVNLAAKIQAHRAGNVLVDEATFKAAGLAEDGDRERGLAHDAIDGTRMLLKDVPGYGEKGITVTVFNITEGGLSRLRGELAGSD